MGSSGNPTRKQIEEMERKENEHLNVVPSGVRGRTVRALVQAGIQEMRKITEVLTVKGQRVIVEPGIRKSPKRLAYNEIRKQEFTQAQRSFLALFPCADAYVNEEDIRKVIPRPSAMRDEIQPKLLDIGWKCIRHKEGWSITSNMDATDNV